MWKLKVKPKGEKLTIYLPKELSNQELEVTISPVKMSKNQVERIRNILKTRPKSMFHLVNDPVAWQRSLREEWKM